MPVALHHVEAGPTGAETVVLLSSLGSTHRMWDELVADLAEKYRIVAVDTRGHGASPGAVGPLTVADLADDVLALVSRVGIDRFHLVGLSLGGAISQRVALAAQHKLASLTLACTAARFGDPRTWTERAAAVRAEGTGQLREPTGGRWFTDAVRAERPDRVRDILDLLVDTEPESYAVCCEALAEFDARPDLGDLAVPTLVIGGTLDPTCPPAVVDELREHIPRAELALIEDAAHLANICRPKAFATAVRGHLRAHAVGRSA